VVPQRWLPALACAVISLRSTDQTRTRPAPAPPPEPDTDPESATQTLPRQG
jgi:hypothetical protein